MLFISCVVRRAVLVLVSAIIAVNCGFAQELKIVSPEVHQDRTVTFRLRAPGAKQVMLAQEGAVPVPMTSSTEGVWALTTGPLAPDVYGYSFLVDGVGMVDPENTWIKTNLLQLENMVHVPGSTPLPWETANVPHGQIHHHFYSSAVIGDQRDLYVYTPPNYDPKSKQRYPVLYLLHGFSDDASGWTAVGQANLILDNLIAQDKAKAMIVVMPLGYGAPEFIARGWQGFGDTALRQRNFDKFRENLLTEIIPQIEKGYRVSADRKDRAIAGLSMGGAESLYTGLNNIEKFAWIGAFSSGGVPDFTAAFASVNSTNTAKLRLLWISCGKDDWLITPNRQLKGWLKTKNVEFKDIETPGAHTWMVWRRNLAEFAPLLFR